VTTLHAVPDDTDGPRYSSAEVCALSGVSYKQLTYWSRIPEHLGQGDVGSGHQRSYTAFELDTVRLVRHLIAEGFTVPAAFRVAREVIEHDRYETTVADIFTLSVHVRTTTARPTEGDRL
jgi:DNA-binding transcriptional MerR regulator